LKRAIRRLLASIMLVVVVASLAAPPHAMAAACGEDGGAGGTPALVAAMDHGVCEHPGAGPCLAAVGCYSATVALRPVTAAVSSPLAFIPTGPATPPHYADLCRNGPPTPPPNSI